MKFVDIDAMSLPNLSNLHKLIEYAKEYTYYQQIDVGSDGYVFAFHYDPFTIAQALLEWEKFNS